MLGIVIGWREGSIIRVRVCARRAPVSSAGNTTTGHERTVASQREREVLLKNGLACLCNH